jgi:hypothetical protein
VAEKHDFQGIQLKIPQISDFSKNWDSNPTSHGDTAADIAKMFAKFFFAKIGVWVKKTRFSQKSDRIFAKFPGPYPKNRIPQKTFFTIFTIFPQLYNFREIKISMILYAKIGFKEKLFS